MLERLGLADPGTALYCVVVVFAAYLIRGTAGFGSGLIAVAAGAPGAAGVRVWQITSWDGATRGQPLPEGASVDYPPSILILSSRQPMPAVPALMHAAEVSRPFHTPGWIYEEKVDGWRMLALKDNGTVRLISRNGRDHTKRVS